MKLPVRIMRRGQNAPHGRAFRVCAELFLSKKGQNAASRASGKNAQRSQQAEKCPSGHDALLCGAKAARRKTCSAAPVEDAISRAGEWKDTVLPKSYPILPPAGFAASRAAAPCPATPRMHREGIRKRACVRTPFRQDRRARPGTCGTLSTRRNSRLPRPARIAGSGRKETRIFLTSELEMDILPKSQTGKRP